MNRAERRRAAAIERKAKQRWARDVRRFHGRAAGLLSIELVRPTQEAAPLLRSWFRQAAALPMPPLCMFCDTELSPPTNPDAFIVSRGAVFPTPEGLLCGICRDCAARDGETLLRNGVETMRKIWPDLRAVDPAALHLGGRA